MDEKIIAEFVKDRNMCLEDFVINDNLEGYREHCKRWGMFYPKDEIIFKVGLYKAVQEVPELSEEVKQMARSKCIILGFNPEMR